MPPRRTQAHGWQQRHTGPEPVVAMPVPGKVQERCASRAVGRANKAKEKDIPSGQVGAGRSVSPALVTGACSFLWCHCRP